jgi:hypothetical protein
MMARRRYPSTRDDRGPAPGLSADDSRHLALRANMQQMTTRTGSGGPMPLNVCAVASADGVASLLATVLAVSERPATLLLEELAHTEIRIEVISRTDRNLTASEHYQLDADPITSGQHHAGLLRTTGGLVAAETELVILPQRLPTDARVALADARIPADKILAPLGVRRLDHRVLCRGSCQDSAGKDVAVESFAVLAIGDTKVGVTTERVTGKFCRFAAEP